MRSPCQFDYLPEATRQDSVLAVASLRQRYVNPQLQELKRIAFHSRKFKPYEVPKMTS